MISNVGKIKGTILILGETGVGKSYFAREIHKKSYKKNSPFIEVNLAGLSSQLFASELFGHIKGSFTGAFSDKAGYCDQVKDGILFLDEIGELSLDDQKKLLLFLESREYYAIGSTKKKTFYGQVILATNKDLPEMVEKGSFRRDLFYRIRVFEFTLCGLKDDHRSLLSLARKFWEQECEHYQKKLNYDRLRIDEHVLRHDWPGNIRELKNTIEYIVFYSENDKLITPSWLEQNVHDTRQPTGSYESALQVFEKKFLLSSLKRNRGKINQTSRVIGISKVTLLKKIQKYGIREMLESM